jgi:hypothetical protein
MWSRQFCYLLLFAMQVSVVRRKQKPPTAPLSGNSSTKSRKYAMKTIYVSRMSKAMLKEFENEVAVLQQL